MRLLCLALLLLVRIPVAWAAPQGDEPLPTDPRVIEANALLEDKDQYPRVIALYSEALEDEPNQPSTRLWLARVLSWHGDHEDSLSQYQVLLAGRPVPTTARIERAEVLSWAGEYDEALEAFEQIAERDPHNARAARGIARVYNWSQRRSEAVKAYRHALLLGDDAETQRELDRLLSGIGSGGDSRSRYVSDSDGFRLRNVTATGSVDLSVDTRVLLSGSYTRVSHSHAGPGLGKAEGASGFIGLEQRLRRDLEARVEVGYRWWNEASGHVLGRGVLQYSLPSNTVLGLEVEHGDFLSHSDSLRVVLEGLDQTSLLARAWQGFPRGWSVFAQVGSSFVSDSNRRIALNAGGEFQPLPDHEIAVGLSFNYLTYTKRSSLYYDPTTDLGAGLSARAGHALFDWLDVSVEGVVGIGYAAEANTSGFGLTYAISGGPEIQYEGVSLKLHAARSQSQRASVYTSHSFGFSLGMKF